MLEVLGEQQAAVLLGLAGFGAVVVGQVEVGDAVVEGGEDRDFIWSNGVMSPKLCQKPSETAGNLRPEVPARL